MGSTGRAAAVCRVRRLGGTAWAMLRECVEADACLAPSVPNLGSLFDISRLESKPETVAKKNLTSG